MSNHSDKFDREMAEHMRKMFGAPQDRDEIQKALSDKLEDIYRQGAIGATGRHPEGTLTKMDRGEVAFLVGVKDGRVVIEFHEPMHWLGLTPEQAVQLAELLIKRARKAGFTRMVSLEL